MQRVRVDANKILGEKTLENAKRAKFFANCQTVEEVKQLYKGLALSWHPDRGGNTAAMQEVNAQYTKRLQELNGTVSKDDQGNDHTYRYNEEREQALIDKIAEVIASGILSDTVEFYLVGAWLWIIGETKPVKDQLGKSGLGFMWHQKRVAWYWHTPDYKSGSAKNKDFAGLAEKYGATRLRGKDEEK